MAMLNYLTYLIYYNFLQIELDYPNTLSNKIVGFGYEFLIHLRNKLDLSDRFLIYLQFNPSLAPSNLIVTSRREIARLYIGEVKSTTKFQYFQTLAL